MTSAREGGCHFSDLNSKTRQILFLKENLFVPLHYETEY